jgi:hypothetical protein
MSIVLVGSTSGSVTLQEPAVAGTTVLTLPAVSGTVLTTTSPKAGNVLQVVQTFYKTTESIASATWTATGISASITPISTSNKILVIVTAITSTTNDTYGGFRLYRNASEVTGANATAASGSAVNAFIAISPTYATPWNNTLTSQYLDSPSSTSAQTYTLYWARTYNGTINLNRPNNLDTGNSYSICAPSSITLMEIAA